MAREMHELCEKVTRLESRVEGLRRQRTALLGVAALIAGAAFSAAPQDLTVRSLTILGADGKRQVLLIADEQGGQVNVYSKSGARALAAGVDHGAGYSDWYGADGERRATVFTGASGSGQFQFMNPAKQPIAVIGADAQGGFLNIRTHPGAIASYLEVDKNGNGIMGVYAGSDGARRSIVGVDERGVGAVQVFDPSGRTRGRLP